MLNDENGNSEFPLDLIVTGTDILIFWVERIISLSFLLFDKVPVKNFNIL